ncbi:NAD(P)-binding protein [Periconia macrospinosa]|uniref:NAD(P)-binding protein n=1 Tax=Periconia macrospinosa TaxID=97972 RepID=A0A2V1DCT6_9PLEO|nr:NAD(P)-binding protein [Periconia macrospinosa]
MSPTRKKILITGASSGLGHTFLTHYASQPHTTIYALDQTPLPPLHVEDASAATRIHSHVVDITSVSAVAAVVEKISSSDGVDDAPIDLLIHSAGIRGLVPKVVREKRGDVGAAEEFSVMDHETMMKTFEVNTWGTFNIIRTFLPMLRRADGNSEGAKVVVMSSRMGSVEANTSGAGYAYRASKAALNAVVKSFSVDVKDVTFLLLHPGRVETGLVEWKEEGAMSAEESLRTCLGIIEGCKSGDSGKFVDRFGEVIKW